MAKTVVYQIEVVTSSLQAGERSINSFIERNKVLKAALAEVPGEGSQAYKDLDQVIRLTTNNTETLQDRVNKLKEEYATGRGVITDFNRELRQGEQSLNTINSLRNTVIQLNRELDNTEIGSKRFQELSVQSGKATRELKELEQQTLRFQRNVGNYQQIGQNLISTFQRVGAAIFAAFTIDGLINLTQRAVEDLIQTARDYGQAVATVGAISGATEEQLAALDARARELGESTAFSATSAAEGMIEFSRAGFEVDETLKAIEPTLNLAVAANAQLGRTTEVASSALRTYGLDAEETARVTDVIAATFTSSQTTLESYAESFKQIGPAARSLEIPFEEVSAIIGLFGDQGLRGTEATTSFRTSLARLAAQPKPVREELERLNLSAFNQRGEFIGIANLLQELEERYANYTDEQRQASISLLFGNRALTQANILLNTSKTFVGEFGEETLKGSEALRQYTSDLIDAGASQGQFTQNIADQQLDNFNGDITLLRSATEGLQLALFDLVENELRSFVQGVRGVVSALTDFISGQTNLRQLLGENIGVIRLIAVAFGTYTATVVANTIANRVNAAQQALNRAEMLKGTLQSQLLAVAKAQLSVATQFLTGRIGLVTAATKLYRLAQIGLNAALAANPIGVIVIAAGALAAAFVALYNNSEQFRAVVSGLGEVFQNVWNRIRPVLIAIGALFAEVFDAIFQIGRTVVTFYVEAWATIFRGAATALNFVLEQFQNFRTFVRGIFSDIFEAAREFLSPVINFFSPFTDRVGAALEGALDIVRELFGRIRDAAVSALSGIFDFFNIDTKGLTDSITGVVDAVRDVASGSGQSLADSFTEGFEGRLSEELRDKLKDQIEKALNDDPNFDFESVKGWIAAELTRGVLTQEDADNILQQFQKVIDESEVSPTVSVNDFNFTDDFADDNEPENPTAGGAGPNARNVLRERQRELEEAAAELEETQRRISVRGLEILRQQRIAELAQDEAFQNLRADQQIRILQDIEQEYTEARLDLESQRQGAIQEERDREVDLLLQRARTLTQVTSDLGADEAALIRQNSQQSIQALNERYNAQISLVESRSQEQAQALIDQLQSQLITQEEFDTELARINTEANNLVTGLTRQRDNELISITEDTNNRLLQLASERQQALGDVEVGAVSDITSNYQEQIATLDELREKDIIDARDYALQREDIERELTEVLVNAASESVQGIETASEESYRRQIDEALDFRNQRLRALREAYTQDAGLAAGAFEEQRQLLEQQYSTGEIEEEAFRTNLQQLQNEYYAGVQSAQNEFQSNSLIAQQEFENQLVTLSQERVTAINAIETQETTDLTSTLDLEIAEQRRLYDEGLITQETFALRSRNIQANYQASLADVQARANAQSVVLDRESFDVRTQAAQDFRRINEETFESVYEGQVQAISEAANAQAGILDSTNQTLIQLGENYNRQSEAENERYTQEFVNLIQERSGQIESISQNAISGLSNQFEADVVRLNELRELDLISATEYAEQLAEAQATLQSGLAGLQENTQVDGSEFLQQSFSQQLREAQNFNQLRVQQINDQRDREISAAQETATSQLELLQTRLDNEEITVEAFNASREAIEENHTARLAQINATYAELELNEQDRFGSERRDIIQGYLDEIERQFDTDRIDLTQQFNAQVDELTRLRDEDLISAQEYVVRRELLDGQLERDLLRLKLEGVRQRLEIAGLETEEILRLKAQEAQILKDISKSEVETVENAEERKRDLIKETRRQQEDALRQLQALVDNVSDIIGGSVRQRIAALEEEKRQVEETTEQRVEEANATADAAIATAEQTIVNEEAREAEIASIEATRDANVERIQTEAQADIDSLDLRAAAEERKNLRIEAIEKRLQGFRDLVHAIQLAQDSARILSTTQVAAAEVAAAGTAAAANSTAAVAKTAASVPFPANIAAIVGIIAAIASGIAAVRRIFSSRDALTAGTGGLITIVDQPIEYMAQGGAAGYRRFKRRRRNSKRRIRRVPRNRAINMGRSHNRDGSLGGGILTELERNEWVTPVEGVKMFKAQLAWMTQQANAKKSGRAYSSVFPEELFPTQPAAQIRKRVAHASRTPAIQLPRRVSYGYAQDGGEVLSGLTNLDFGGLVTTGNLDGLVSVMSEISAKLDRIPTEDPQPTQVTLSLLRLREAEVKLQSAENRANT